MIPDPLVGAAAWPYSQRLHRVQEPEFISATQPLPFRLRFLRRFDTIGGTAEREGLHLVVGPARKVPHTRIGADHGCLRGSAAAELFQKLACYRAVPFIRSIRLLCARVMSAETLCLRLSLSMRACFGIGIDLL